ncbi:MAG TPA: SMI1/KNR4 family protein [Longimicrobiaceae bacterium]|jgi:hypothetical protein
MAQSLLGRLEALGAPQLFWNNPGDPGALDAVEAELGQGLPEDYREVMRARGGFALSRPGTPLNLFRADELSGQNADEEFEEGLPGMFMIGTDGGGSAYFYDPEGRLGRGKWALFLAPFSDLYPAAARFAGASLSDAVDAALRGEDLYVRPPLGAGPAGG